MRVHRIRSWLARDDGEAFRGRASRHAFHVLIRFAIRHWVGLAPADLPMVGMTPVLGQEHAARGDEVLQWLANNQPRSVRSNERAATAGGSCEVAVVRRRVGEVQRRLGGRAGRAASRAAPFCGGLLFCASELHWLVIRFCCTIRGGLSVLLQSASCPVLCLLRFSFVFACDACCALRSHGVRAWVAIDDGPLTTTHIASASSAGGASAWPAEEEHNLAMMAANTVKTRKLKGLTRKLAKKAVARIEAQLAVQ